MNLGVNHSLILKRCGCSKSRQGEDWGRPALMVLWCYGDSGFFNLTWGRGWWCWPCEGPGGSQCPLWTSLLLEMILITDWSNFKQWKCLQRGLRTFWFLPVWKPHLQIRWKAPVSVWHCNCCGVIGAPISRPLPLKGNGPLSTHHFRNC